MNLDDFPLCEENHLDRYGVPLTIDKNVLRCARIDVGFTRKQKAIIVKWFDVYRWAYNLAVKYIRDEHYRKVKQTTSFETLRDLLTNKYKSQIDQYIKTTKIPKHTIDEAFHDVIKAYKTAFTMIRNKKIKYFRLRYKRQEKPIQTLCLEGLAFEGKKERIKRNNTFCPSVFGTYIATSKSIKHVNHACRLSWDKKRNKFTLFVPTDRPVQNIPYKSKFCSLDPGVRTFMTLYDGERTLDFGSNEPKQIKALLQKLDSKARFKNLGWYKKYHARIQRRINGLTDNLHWKTAIELTRRYDNILIGNMSTLGIVRHDTSKLDAMTKRICYALSHYTFKQRLKAKAEEWGSNVFIIDERYTSQTCGSCRHRNRNLGSAKVYVCPRPECTFIWGRDQNGARNIALKHYDLFNPIH